MAVAVERDARADIKVGERRRQDLVPEVWRTRETAALGLVPAVRAGVLAAVHAEVEGLVEGVELLRQASLELNETESKVKELVERADGILELRDFGG